jgi:hypothetical protein
MEMAQVLALAAFVATAVVVALGVRSASRVLSRTRQAEGFRGDIDDLARRIDTSLTDISKLIDDVRRHAAPPDAILDNIDLAMDAVERYEEETHALGGPPDARPHRDAIAWELQRAGRALALVAHGCKLASSGRREERGPEAETSIKRGYLNLVHARESIGEHAIAAVDAAEAASPVRRLQGRKA